MSMAGGVIPAKPRGILGVIEALVLSQCMAIQPANLACLPANPPPPPARPDPNPNAGRGLAMPRGFPVLGWYNYPAGGNSGGSGGGFSQLKSNLESAQRSSISIKVSHLAAGTEVRRAH